MDGRHFAPSSLDLIFGSWFYKHLAATRLSASNQNLILTDVVDYDVRPSGGGLEDFD